MTNGHEAWHTLAVADAIRVLDVDPTRGLSSQEVATRRARHGLNSLPEAPRKSLIRVFLEQFVNPLVATLLVAAIISIVVAMTESGSGGLSQYSDAIAIGFIVLVNAIVGAAQERKAEAALDALKRMSSPTSRVIRDGETLKCDARDLVPGDVVELEEGDAIPADLRLLRAANFHVVEASLTGESEPIHKQHELVLAPDTAVSDRLNMAFLGTTVSRGQAQALVTEIGRNTQIGHIGSLLAQGDKPLSPLERRLKSFGNTILWGCLAISALLFVVGLARGGKISVVLLTAVSLAVAAIPEGLPAITTITLALGMQRMATRNAVVRKLAAVETLGTVETICSDKTGTLTRNEMAVREVWTAEGHFAREPDATSFAPTASTDTPDTTQQASVRALLEVGVVCNSAAIERGENGVRKVVGDPTEGALLLAADDLGITRADTLRATSTARVVPFDSDRKRMSLVLEREGTYTLYAKGALETILARCSHVLVRGEVHPLETSMRETIRAQAAEQADRALRVLALARKQLSSNDLTLDDEALEQDLVFVGLAGLLDPPRRGVREAVSACRAAGIRVVMITGDHPRTAQAIARELGLWEASDRTCVGSEIDTMSDEVLAEQAAHIRVFARVAPEHKLRIVRALQRPPHNHVVAMTGDGVNDAPAIRESDIGIAMGRNGTEVARQAADLVLADDNFATLIDAVREGRAIFTNIRKAIFFLLSANAGLCIAVFIAALWPGMESLSPLQILWINLVTNGLPALALGVDNATSDQMNRGPRPPSEPLLVARDWWGVLAVGLVMGLSAIAIQLLPLWNGVSLTEARTSKLTMMFTVLALSPLAHAFNCRSETSSIRSVGLFSNRWLVGAVIASAAIHFVSLGVSALRPIFRTDHAWTLTEILLVVGIAILPIPVIEIFKAMARTYKPTP